jgi:hypothetical protein
MPAYKMMLETTSATETITDGNSFDFSMGISLPTCVMEIKHFGPSGPTAPMEYMTEDFETSGFSPLQSVCLP